MAIAVVLTYQTKHGVHKVVAEVRNGFKLISGKHFKYVVLLPKGMEFRLMMSMLHISSCPIHLMEAVGLHISKLIVLKW